MISVGHKFPTDLTLKTAQPDGERVVRLKDLLNRRTVVSVYMKNNTGSCDRQNESLTAAMPDFDRLGYNVVALSRDGCTSHRNYAKKKGLKQVLVSDPDDVFSKAADAMVEKSMYGKTFVGPARAAYVLDRDGTVLAVIPKVDTADHAAQVKAVLAGLR